MTHVGWRALDVVDAAQGAQVPAGLFYPTRAEPAPVAFDAFTLDVAADASVEGTGLPVVLFSHGTGSSPWLLRGLGLRLARAGFVAAMVRHPGNNRGDDALAFTIENLENRPRHLRLVLDAALADPRVGPHLHADAAAVLGHSLGGYTALAIAGGNPTTGSNDSEDGRLQRVRVEHDPRVRALVLLAPAAAWFTEEGALSAVTVPILVRTGDQDRYAPPGHGEIVERGVPDPSRVDHRVVAGAGHFSFMTPIPEELKRPDLPPAHDPPGFDRVAYEAVLGEEIVRFLRAALVFAIAILFCPLTGGCAQHPVPGVALPLYPMALVFSGPLEAAEPVGELRADGAIATRREGVVARLFPDRVIGRDGRTKIVVAPNGEVWVDPKLPPMRFDARGALVSPTGESIYVDDRGIPSWSGPRVELPSLVGVHFMPFDPEARRTAEVVFAILLEVVWSRVMT